MPATDLTLPAARDRLYAAVAVALFVMAVTATAAKSHLLRQPFLLPVSDGAFYYVYLPSLVRDGDLDFGNQIVEHWGCGRCPPLLDLRTDRGYIRNKYPIGLALTLAPAFLAAHALASLGYAVSAASWLAPDGYSPLYQLSCLAFLHTLGFWTLRVADRLAVERWSVRPAAATAAVIAYWLGSSYTYYYAREPFMVHVASTFWVTQVLAAAIAIIDARPRPVAARPLFLLLAGTTMAIVCRPTNVFVLPVLIAAGLAVLGSGLSATARRALPAIMALTLIPLVLQAAIWHRMTGSWLTYTYGHEGFVWSRPALWQTLFSSRHGLFFWSPLLLAAPAGWWLSTRRDRPKPVAGGLGPAFLAAAVLLWYLNSAWWAWWFGGSFGGRAFLELTLLGVLGIAFALDAAWARGRRLAHVTLAILFVLVALNWALIVLYVTHRIPRDDYLLGSLTGLVASSIGR